MNNENSMSVDGPETPGSSESAEKMKTLKKPGVMSSRWFLPVVLGASMGIVMAVMMAVMMPKLWYLWMSVGWGMGFAIGTSLRSSEASKPSEVAVSE